MKGAILSFFKQSRGFFAFLLLMSVFRSGVADWNVVPSESMLPTIVVGDRILVNKLAYDIQVPFLYTSLKKLGDPQRGDIIVFNSDAAQLRLVKRVVAVPGDTVEMSDNVLSINGKPLSYQALNVDTPYSLYRENLQGVEHQIRVNAQRTTMSSFDAIVVPDQYYLALGDNRNNSADSRVIGLIPRQEIIGRASKVVMSLDYDHFYMPRAERFWQTL